MTGVAKAAKKAPLACEQTIISKVAPFFAGDPGSGIVLYFNTAQGVQHFKDPDGKPMRAMIAERDPKHGAPITKARVGDAVKLCLIEYPEKATGCDPAADPRGRIYSAYDARLHATIVGANSEHMCGGA